MLTRIIGRCLVSTTANRAVAAARSAKGAMLLCLGIFHIQVDYIPEHILVPSAYLSNLGNSQNALESKLLKLVACSVFLFVNITTLFISSNYGLDHFLTPDKSLAKMIKLYRWLLIALIMLLDIHIAVATGIETSKRASVTNTSSSTLMEDGGRYEKAWSGDGFDIYLRLVHIDGEKGNKVSEHQAHEIALEAEKELVNDPHGDGTIKVSHKFDNVDVDMKYIFRDNYPRSLYHPAEFFSIVDKFFHFHREEGSEKLFSVDVDLIGRYKEKIGHMYGTMKKHS